MRTAIFFSVRRMGRDELSVLLKPFFVHMDDANERVCDAALDAVLAAAAVAERRRRGARAGARGARRVDTSAARARRYA